MDRIKIYLSQFNPLAQFNSIYIFYCYKTVYGISNILYVNVHYRVNVLFSLVERYIGILRFEVDT